MSEVKTLVPKLRFPEFRDVGDWSYMRGDKVFTPISNKKHNSDLPILAITQKHGAIPREHIDYNVSVTEKSVKNYKVVDIGDFIISLRSFQGGLEYSNYKGICSPAYIILRKKIHIIEQFYKQYFKTNAFILDLNRDIEGIRDGKMVSYKQFSDILLPVPKPVEQQKIANCLSSLDELITAHSEKHAALKAHKKGLMQQLFPCEGKTTPKLRFPEFRGKGEWEDKLFGKILKVHSGKGFKASEYSKVGIRLLQIENVGYGVTKWNENTIFLPEKYAFEYSELILQKGDIVLALNRPVTNNELKIARIQKDDEPLILYQRVGKLVLLNNSLNKSFVFQITTVRFKTNPPGIPTSRPYSALFWA